MLIVLTIIHVLVCLFLIGVVLLQSGKAADLAGAFGGMGSQTAFGPRGAATALSRATTASAIVFMITSISLSIVATRNAGGGANTVLDRTAPRQTNSTTNANPDRPTVTVGQEGTTGTVVPLPLDSTKKGATGETKQPAPAEKK